jgi:hypothetical protein
MRHQSTLAAAFLAVLVTAPARASSPSKAECLEANDQAQDLRRAGKLIEARAKLAVCVATTCPGAVRQDCSRWLGEVNEAIPSLVFEASNSAGNDVAAVRVTMDGKPFAEKLDGSALQVDPGKHLFTFDDAGGHAHVEKTVDVREGVKDRHVSVVLGARLGTDTPADAEAHPHLAGPDHPSSTPTSAYVALGLAGAAVIAGSVFTGVYVAADSHCPNQKCPSGNAAPVAQWGVGISFGVAAVAAVVGLVLLGSQHDQPGTAQASTVEPRLRFGPTGVDWRF